MIIADKFLLVHGGVSQKIESRNDLSKPSLSGEIDILWSDPIKGNWDDRQNTIRGAGVLFGKKTTELVCKRLEVEKIIRSHQPQVAQFSPKYHHKGKVITVNSTSVYGGKPHILFF